MCFKFCCAWNINLRITMRIKSVQIKKQVLFGKDMLVFNIKQVNFYNDFWIKTVSMVFLSKFYVKILDTFLISIAFLASHSSMEAFMKQKLNAGTFLRNQWRKVDYTNETIHAAWCLNQTNRLFPPHDSLFVHQRAILLTFCLSCCHPTTKRRTPCIASVGLTEREREKKKTSSSPRLKFFRQF